MERCPQQHWIVTRNLPGNGLLALYQLSPNAHSNRISSFFNQRSFISLQWSFDAIFLNGSAQFWTTSF